MVFGEEGGKKLMVLGREREIERVSAVGLI